MMVNSKENPNTRKESSIPRSVDVHKSLTEVLVSNLDTMRYMEMMSLFNAKPYDEGIVRTENHARTFLYFFNLAQLEDEEINNYLEKLQIKHPNLKGSVYLRKHQEKKFISLEPLFPDSGEKEIAQKLADDLRFLLTQKNQNLSLEL